MSDEHDHDDHDHIAPFVLQMGPTPEQLEASQMRAIANSHEMRGYLNDLSELGLTKTISIVQQIMSDPHGAGMYYIGIMAQMLDDKFNKCITCGQDHDNPFPAEMGSPESTPERTPDNTGPLPTKGSEAYDADMELYNLESDDDGSERVMCKGCGQWYISLADRMLRAPGVAGCGGCIQTTKWG